MSQLSCKDKKCPAIDLRLSDIMNPTAPNGFTPSSFLNANGSIFYTVNSAFPALATNSAAQFGTNVNGKLTVTTSIPVDAVNYPDVEDGSLNPAGTLASLLDDNIPVTGQGRVRIIDVNGQVVAQRIFSDLLIDPSLNFGSFLFKGKKRRKSICLMLL